MKAEDKTSSTTTNFQTRTISWGPICTNCTQYCH